MPPVKQDSDQVLKSLMGVPPSPPHKSRAYDHDDMPRARSEPNDRSPAEYAHYAAHFSPPPFWAPAAPPNMLNHPRSALPPLEEPHNGKVFAFAPPAMSSTGPEAKEAAAYALNHASPLPRAHQLEPLAANWALPAGASLQDRIGMMEQRLLAAERTASKVRMLAIEFRQHMLHRPAPRVGKS